MREIDGRIGGGNVLRIALGLSIATDTPFTLQDVRATRPQPGLKQQHLAAVQAAAQLSNAAVQDDELGSRTLTFDPGGELNDSVRVEVPTAGAVGLVLQPLLIAAPALDKTVNVVVDGGATAGKWAPPVPTLQHVLLPVLARFSVDADITVQRHGCYPEGGALTRMTIAPAALPTLELTDRGAVEQVRGQSLASQHLAEARVANRQRQAARKEIAAAHPSRSLDIAAETVETRSPGSVIALQAVCEHSVLGADALGEKGKRAEIVGAAAAQELVAALETGAAVDAHTADLLVPFLGIAGGVMTVARVTDHVAAAMQVTERFVDRGFDIADGDVPRVMAD